MQTRKEEEEWEDIVKKIRAGFKKIMREMKELRKDKEEMRR